MLDRLFSLISDFFDTMGTVIGIGGERGKRLLGHHLHQVRRRVSEGAKAGLASVVTGLCFLLALFFAPIAGIVPPQATATALIVVGYLMCGSWGDTLRGSGAGVPSAPAPAGFIAYSFVKLVRGKGGEVHPMMYGTALAFLVYFALPWLHALFSF